VIFLVEYDRPSGHLISIREFASNERAQASQERLDLEIRLLKESVIREVVLLESESLEDLQKTHRRYFRGVKEIANSIVRTTKMHHHPDESGQ